MVGLSRNYCPQDMGWNQSRGKVLGENLNMP